MWCSLADNVFLSGCSCPPLGDDKDDGNDGDGDDDDNDNDGDGVRQQVMSS